jgi:predicted acyl esterase
MNMFGHPRALTLLAPVLATLLWSAPAAAQTPPPKYPALPTEIPATFKPATEGLDYIRRDVMIPMRDGIGLHRSSSCPGVPTARRSS